MYRKTIRVISIMLAIALIVITSMTRDNHGAGSEWIVSVLIILGTWELTHEKKKLS